MRRLGTIVRLQYQRDHLKVPAEPFRYYDPVNIVQADELRLTPDGVEAGLRDAPIYDVHHTMHQRSRNRGDNGISIGFTGHYAAMRERFGERIATGIAGENILIELDGIVREGDLAAGLIVETGDGPVAIAEIGVAAPCVEFSRFAIDYPRDRKPDRSVSEALQFLHHGMRGFYATIDAQATIRVGDIVFFRD